MDTMTELLSIPSVSQMLKENDRRNEIIYATFNPITGQGSIGRRIRIEISDFILPVQWDSAKHDENRICTKAGRGRLYPQIPF